MGDIPSKTHESGPAKVLKENKEPKRCPPKKCPSPKLRVNFKYIKPLNIEIEEMPDDEVLHNSEDSMAGSRTGTTVMPTESYFTFTQFE